MIGGRAKDFPIFGSKERGRTFTIGWRSRRAREKTREKFCWCGGDWGGDSELFIEAGGGGPKKGRDYLLLVRGQDRRNKRKN